MSKTKKKTPPTKKKTKTTTQHFKPAMHWFKKGLIYSFVFASFIFLSYIGYLDYTVRKQFEGKRWSIPARVYASPVEIYAGYTITLNQFDNLLQQLNYRRDYHLTSGGTYFRKGSRFYLKTREFIFWDKTQPSQRLSIQLVNQTIKRITDQTTRQSLPIVRMEPVQIGSFYPTRKEDRVLIKLEQAPDSLIQGLIATEDHNFYQHFGISFKAIARALWANVRAGSVVQGGSTITQQLVKNFYLSSDRSLWRKINEALMALILEFRYQKDEILEAYLNEIYLGQDGARSVHGFGLASEFYFGRPLKKLPLHEVASLVALVRGPSYYDPRKHPERSIKRRNLVLDAMQQQGHITLKQAQAAKHHQLKVIARTHHSVNRYPGFLDLVKRQLRQEYREDDLTSEGLRIFTTLDTQVQNTLERTITRKIKQLEKRPRSRRLETATVVTRRETGEVVALAGGRQAKNVGFNRALDAVRPIGSLIKPVVYLTALEYPERYTLTTLVNDTAIKIKTRQGQYWQPHNYDKKEHGEIPLHTALAHSYNLATVNIGMDVGIGRVAKTLRNMGVNRPINLYPSMLLGASPLTPLEVTQMYQTLAGDGFATPLRSIQAVIAADGTRLQNYPYTIRQTVDPAATYLTNKMLQEVMYEGTGRSAYLYIPKEFALVGKTGTTNKLRDSWFAGYSGDYLAVTWVGRDDNKPSGLTGASGALQIWIALMRQISTQPVTLIPPDNVINHWIDPDNGLLANEACEGAIIYPYTQGSEPQQNSPCVESPMNTLKSWFGGLLNQ